MVLILIRLCGGFCRLNHIARATPPSLSFKALQLFDEDIRQCFSSSAGIDASDAAWQQAQLSLSRGGLGLRSLAHHASAAFISSLSSSGLAPDSSQHLSDAVGMFNRLVPAEAEETALSLRTSCHLLSLRASYQRSSITNFSVPSWKLLQLQTRLVCCPSRHLMQPPGYQCHHVSARGFILNHHNSKLLSSGG